jgi:DNA-binding transcriptional LysR family regulator
LETRLGARLFERTRAGIVLTPEGEALAARARMLDHLLRDAQSDVAAAGKGLGAPLRVGGTPGALVSLLPRALALMEAKHPHLTLNVLERPDRDLMTMLRDGDIDLAFVTTAIEAPPPTWTSAPWPAIPSR